MIFATWFTYDATGKAWWLSMTANATTSNIYSGTLYQTHGPAFGAVPFSPAAVTATPVGTGTLTFSDNSNGSFSYTVNGIQQTKPITRQVFGPLPSCTFGSATPLAQATNYQDLWWAAPAGAESGWGVNFTQQGDTIFATWFTYDTDGSPLWLSATAQQVVGGRVHRDALPDDGPGVQRAAVQPEPGRRHARGHADAQLRERRHRDVRVCRQRRFAIEDDHATSVSHARYAMPMTAKATAGDFDARIGPVLARLGLQVDGRGRVTDALATPTSGPALASTNPANGATLGTVATATPADLDALLARATIAALAWRDVPAPRRGQAVRRCADLLREHKDALGTLVTLENGKIKAEGDGEVQEMIDIAEFAVGQSRMLYGKTLHSERPAHRMYEQWHPLGVVGVVTATGKLKAVITPTTPSGCHCSYIRCAGRSECIVLP